MKSKTQCEGLLAKAPKQRVILGGVDHIMIELKYFVLLF